MLDRFAGLGIDGFGDDADRHIVEERFLRVGAFFQGQQVSGVEGAGADRLGFAGDPLKPPLTKRVHAFACCSRRLAILSPQAGGEGRVETGGSTPAMPAGQAQHVAPEMTGKFGDERISTHPVALFPRRGYTPPVRTVRQGMPWPFFMLEMGFIGSFLKNQNNGVAKCPR